MRRSNTTRLARLGFAWVVATAFALALCLPTLAQSEGQVCGGISGATCPDGQFCKLSPGECCCDFQGRCVDVPQGCPLVYDPVCGCDGKTYGNECEADAAGVSVDHRNECERRCGGLGPGACEADEYCDVPPGACHAPGVCKPRPQACPDVFDPVCGCDDETYGNACEAAHAGVAVAYRGECAKECGGFAGVECEKDEYCRLPLGACCCDHEGSCESLPDGCSGVYEPVCGCDGRTYGNACEAARAGVSLAHLGPCPDPQEVQGVRFRGGATMGWEARTDALGYNVYKKVLHRGPSLGPIDPPPFDYGTCLYSDVEVHHVPVPGAPRRGELWLLQVTALFREGEGPMGFASDGTVRKPAAPCRCTLPADPGPCDGAIPRWYHDSFSDSCEPFVYGGCGGNRNNFETKEACAAACLAPCVLAPDPGPCEALVPRWFYSSDTERCWRFAWGGCGGNANNFATFDKCQEACVCRLPADPGPCDGAFPRWYHESSTASCETFVYGGCGGNANNFPEEVACEQGCTDVCRLPAEAGPCDAVIPRWTYDERAGRCTRFVWGGCGGNGNNFESLAACESRCPAAGSP